MHDSTKLDFVAHFASTTPGKLAVVDLAQLRRLSYAELNAAVDRASVVLTEAIGTDPRRQRVVVISRNRVEMLIVHLARIRCGALLRDGVDQSEVRRCHHIRAAQ